MFTDCTKIDTTLQDTIVTGFIPLRRAINMRLHRDKKVLLLGKNLWLPTGQAHNEDHLSRLSINLSRTIGHATFRALVSHYVRSAQDMLIHLLLGYRLELGLTAWPEMEKELHSPSTPY